MCSTILHHPGKVTRNNSDSANAFRAAAGDLCAHRRFTSRMPPNRDPASWLVNAILRAWRGRTWGEQEQKLYKNQLSCECIPKIRCAHKAELSFNITPVHTRKQQMANQTTPRGRPLSMLVDCGRKRGCRRASVDQGLCRRRVLACYMPALFPKRRIKLDIVDSS